MNISAVNVAETVNSTIKASDVCMVSYISTEDYGKLLENHRKTKF